MVGGGACASATADAAMHMIATRRLIAEASPAARRPLRARERIGALERLLRPFRLPHLLVRASKDVERLAHVGSQPDRTLERFHGGGCISEVQQGAAQSELSGRRLRVVRQRLAEGLDRSRVIALHGEADTESVRPIVRGLHALRALVQRRRFLAVRLLPPEPRELQERIQQRGIGLQRKRVLGRRVHGVLLQPQRPGHELMHARAVRRQRVHASE